MTDKERIDSFWFAVENSWNIEPREYFERKAPKSGTRSPEAMAVHHMWKRECKPAPAPLPTEREDVLAKNNLADAVNKITEYQKQIVALQSDLAATAAMLAKQHDRNRELETELSHLKNLVELFLTANRCRKCFDMGWLPKWAGGATRLTAWVCRCENEESSVVYRRNMLKQALKSEEGER